MADIDFDVLFKMILVGDSGVGKSNILTRYTKDSFSFDSKATIGVEFGAKIFNIKDHTIKIQIWDTAGQERYRAITNAYYKGSKGAIIVFDLGRRETYDHVDKWWDDIQKYGDKDICIILIGNKCDLENRTVTKEEVLEKAKSLNMAYIETSAYKSINIDFAFSTIVDHDANKIVDDKEEKIEIQSNAIIINTNVTNAKKKGCC